MSNIGSIRWISDQLVASEEQNVSHVRFSFFSSALSCEASD